MKKHSILLGTLLCLSQLISAQVYPLRPKLSHERSFSMVLIPDPQSYVKFDANQPLFELQTAWIVNSLKSLNIKGVLCTGDLVEQNEIRIPDGVNGNQTSEEQWKAASRAFERLDGKVPYVICTGNHDYGYEKAENRLCHFPDYFPAERNACWRESLVSVGCNYQGIPTLENAAYEFTNKNWGNILVIVLEFAPRDEVLEWAKSLAISERFENHKVFVLTHSYLRWDGSIIEKESYGVSPANYGKVIWEKLLYPCKNIRMLICGHYCSTEGFVYNVGQRCDKNIAGKNVFQMMFNAQTEGGGWHGNGGDGVSLKKSSGKNLF